MNKLIRKPTGRPGPIGQSVPMGLRPGRRTPPPQRIVHMAPEKLMVPSTIAMPDIPAGVVLDGNVEHYDSPRPTVRTKYRD